MRAAAPSEHERPRGKVRRERERLLLERLGLDDRRLWVGKLEPRRLRHRLPLFAPRLRDANEAGVELPAAGMTFIVWTERDRRERLAIRAFRAEAAHIRFFSKRMSSVMTRMPAR